jgi:transcriptional regulator with XRE-family HTH domain
MNHFGAELRRRREAAGLTLGALGALAGVTRNYIGNIENGWRDPSLDVLFQLARGLNVPPWELLGELPELSPLAIEAGRLVERAHPEAQALALRLLRFAVRRS